MIKVLLFLRSIRWFPVLALLLTVAALIAAIYEHIPLTIAISGAALTVAALSTRE